MTPAAPILDRAGALDRIGGDEELYAELIELFLSDVPVQLEVLLNAIEASDSGTAQRQAHSLKSASANIGAEAMRAVCFQAEKAFGERQGDDRLFSQIVEEFERLREFLHSGRG